MNIKTTAYNNEGTLFNLDMIITSPKDFEKMIKVLRTFFDIKQDELIRHEKESPNESNNSRLVQIKDSIVVGNKDEDVKIGTAKTGLPHPDSNSNDKQIGDSVNEDYEVVLCSNCGHKEYWHLKNLMTSVIPDGKCRVEGCKCKKFVFAQEKVQEEVK